ncbi:hypothetical protein OE749_05425 [Aestuariibacter sp. AA17]|uniref:LRAT domain-containing protein n=1 Tax=Fluctibacter corallii TaxID=2984329 RepID=A0ABT3A612_9ALTE|nr:hypothetical protein [Aestuariibacter sp. AA17]MCV2884126.1 hypothetical protein [Aestuariibacter sp. AA17]
MPAPLVWLGLGLASLYASDSLTKAYQRTKGRVVYYPGESELPVKPVNGAVVTCGIFGVFDHTGIWCDDHIVELKGNGLIRGVSPERFLHGRSGEKIYVACDQADQPLIAPEAFQRASEQLFQYSRYHVLDNNCHRFVWQCLSGQRERLTRFTELNTRMCQHFSTPIHWHVAKL